MQSQPVVFSKPCNSDFVFLSWFFRIFLYFQFFTEDPSVANTDYSNVAEDEVEVDDVEDDEAKGEEDDYVENNDVEEEKNYEVEEDDDDEEEEDRSKDRDPNFVRACAVEMQLGMSQEPLICAKKCQ